MAETDKGNSKVMRGSVKRLANIQIGKIVDGGSPWSGWVESVSIRPETTDEDLQKGLHKVEMEMKEPNGRLSASQFFSMVVVARGNVSYRSNTGGDITCQRDQGYVQCSSYL